MQEGLRWPETGECQQLESEVLVNEIRCPQDIVRSLSLFLRNVLFDEVLEVAYIYIYFLPQNSHIGLRERFISLMCF